MRCVAEAEVSKAPHFKPAEMQEFEIRVSDISPDAPQASLHHFFGAFPVLVERRAVEYENAGNAVFPVANAR